MVRLACTKEQDDPTGVEYRVGDAIDLPVLGSFDLVTAVYLLNYATSKDQMLGMCRSAYDNLVAGGRFIAYTVNPAYTLSKPNGAKYGSYFRHMTPEGDRYVCDGEFVTEPPTPYQCFQWHPSEVSSEDVAHYGAAYWQDFYDNCLVIGLVGQK
jgi:toxoflavin synthase